MPSDASRPHSSVRVDAVLPERFKQALIWLCLPILFAVVQEINSRDTRRDVGPKGTSQKQYTPEVKIITLEEVFHCILLSLYASTGCFKAYSSL